MSDFEPKPRATLWLFIILVLVVFAGTVMYFNRNNPDLAKEEQAFSIQPTTTRPTRVYVVSYGLGVFSPTNIRIHVGDSVKFENDSDKPVHLVSDSINNVPDLADFDSINNIQPKDVFSYTFDRSGIFGYHNITNPSEEGTVIVRP